MKATVEQVLSVMTPGTWYRAGDVAKSLGLANGRATWEALMKAAHAGHVVYLPEKGYRLSCSAS